MITDDKRELEQPCNDESKFRSIFALFSVFILCVNILFIDYEDIAKIENLFDL